MYSKQIGREAKDGVDGNEDENRNGKCLHHVKEKQNTRTKNTCHWILLSSQSLTTTFAVQTFQSGLSQHIGFAHPTMNVELIGLTMSATLEMNFIAFSIIKQAVLESNYLLQY
jgi:hypothetical protein